MKKLFKVVSIVVLILIVLFIFLTVGLNVFLKPEFMRNKVSSLVSAKLHRDVAVKGDLTWSLFPRVKITMNHLELGNPNGFVPNAAPFAQVQRLDLGLGLFPLLRGEVEVNYLALRGVTVNLIVNTQGQNSWDMSQLLTASDAKKTDEVVAKNKSDFKVKIDSVFISNVDVNYQDLMKNQKYSIKNLNITASHIRPNKPFDVSVETEFFADKLVSGDLNFSSEVLFNSQMTQLQLGSMRFQSQVKLPDMNPLNVVIKGALLADIDKKHVSLTEFDGTFDAAHLTGEIQSDLGNNPVVLANFKLDAVDPRKIFVLANQAFPAFANNSALSKLTGNFEIRATPNSFVVNKLQLGFDGNTLSGSLGVSDITKKIFQFALSLDQVNLDLYKMKEMPAEVSSNATSKNATAATQANVNSPLRQWGGSGVMSIGKITSGKVVLNNTNVNVSASQGIYNLNPIKTSVFQGNYIGQVTFNSWLSSFNVKGALSGVDAGELMKDLASVTRVQISGKADINESLSSRGMSASEIMKNLNGNVLFVFKNGVLHGIDVPYYFSLGKVLLSGQKSTNVTNTNQTAFGNMTGSFNITQGVATNSDLLLQGPILQAKGAGTADLVNQQINYQLVISSSALGNQTIPLKISGPFANPSITPDLDQLIKAQAKQQIQKQLTGKVTEVLQKNVDKETSDAIVKGLNNLLGS